MMTRQAFLAAFDAARWLTGPAVLDRLEQSGFWDAWWRQASQAAKLAYVANVYWRTQDEDGLPFIVAIDRREGDTRTFMYKPCAALTLDDYLEAHRFFLRLRRYERRAADIAEALALRAEKSLYLKERLERQAHNLSEQEMEGDLLISAGQFWRQKQAEGWVAADGLTDEDIVQDLKEYARWRLEEEA